MFACWERSQLLHFQNQDFFIVKLDLSQNMMKFSLTVRGTPKSGYLRCHGNANTTDSSSSSSFFASWERSQLLHFQNHDFLVDSALVRRTDVKSTNLVHRHHAAIRECSACEPFDCKNDLQCDV